MLPHPCSHSHPHTCGNRCAHTHRLLTDTHKHLSTKLDWILLCITYWFTLCLWTVGCAGFSHNSGEACRSENSLGHLKCVPPFSESYASEMLVVCWVSGECGLHMLQPGATCLIPLTDVPLPSSSCCHVHLHQAGPNIQRTFITHHSSWNFFFKSQADQHTADTLWKSLTLRLSFVLNSTKCTNFAQS